MGKTFIIGDIHGCLQALLALLEKAGPFTDRDTLVFLGDYIDRGPNSKDVVSTIIDLQHGSARLITLLGNHEYMLMQALRGNEHSRYLRLGGYQTLLSYCATEDFAQPLELPAEHLSFFEQLLPFWEDNHYIYVHAGIQPEVPLAMQSNNWLLWAKGEFINSRYDFGKRVIYGHTPNAEPKVESNKIGIDTGAVYGGRLTCLVLPEMEFVSVEGHQYWPS